MKERVPENRAESLQSNAQKTVKRRLRVDCAPSKPLLERLSDGWNLSSTAPLPPMPVLVVRVNNISVATLHNMMLPGNNAQEFGPRLNGRSIFGGVKISELFWHG